MQDNCDVCEFRKEGADLGQVSAEAELSMCRSVQELVILFDISRTIERSFELHDIAQPVLKKLQRVMGLQCGAISLVSKELGQVTVDEAVGLPRESASIYREWIQAVVAHVMEKGEAVVVPDMAESPLLTALANGGQMLAQHKGMSMLCVPMRAENQIVGALSVERQRGLRTGFEADLRLLSMITSLIAQAARVRGEAWQQIATLRAENTRLQEQIARGFRPADMVGTSSAMRNVYYHIEQVASSRTTVLIRGESGTGKELVAKAIHENSPRVKGAFVKFNCAALPDSIIESELFGHEKGAFTGALAMRKGRFEIADGGTIFLDEIGDISPAVQAKLLRVLQEREFERVGSQTPIKVDVRIIAATSRNLEAMMQEDNFRADLYYRLNVFPIYVPPLRERKCDILLLADHFVERYAQMNGSKVRRISSAAIDLLAAYHWPGNVRELENCVERAVLLAKGEAIQAHHLPPTLQMKDAAERDDRATLADALEALEREMVVDALKETNCNMAAAARSLGLTERKMGLRVAKYGIDLRRFKRD